MSHPDTPDAEDLGLLDPAGVPQLDGWLTLSDVSDRLGISRQALHKQIFGTPGQASGRKRLLKTVCKIGESERPPYVFRAEEVEEAARQRGGQPES